MSLCRDRGRGFLPPKPVLVQPLKAAGPMLPHGRLPEASRCRVCETRQRAPFPIPRQARLQDAPLVDRDERIIALPGELGIRNRENFSR